MKRITLITPAHLTNNPRLVKEADALAEAGYRVDVYACQWMDWAAAGDDALASVASWRPRLLPWGRQQDQYLFWKSRLRQRACKVLLSFPAMSRWEPVGLRAYDRVLPELRSLASREPADLFIAHNLQALPVAFFAARKHGAKLGFDAEDFHSGMAHRGEPPALLDRLTEHWERRYLKECAYVTAASPGIAEAYANRYAIAQPTVVLNVFPLADRPARLRPANHRGPLTLYWFSQTIGPTRGLEEAVQALGAAGDADFELHLRGVWERGFRDRLMAVATASGVDPGRIVAHPPGPPGEMARLAAAYDIGLALEQNISVNRDICLTNKIFTYLLAGNAVIATATTGQRPIIEGLGSAAFAYEPGDVKAFARQLHRWAEHRDLLEDARRNAWDWGTVRYNWDKEKETFLAAIGRVFQTRQRVTA